MNSFKWFRKMSGGIWIRVKVKGKLKWAEGVPGKKYSKSIEQEDYRDGT